MALQLASQLFAQLKSAFQSFSKPNASLIPACRDSHLHFLIFLQEDFLWDELGSDDDDDQISLSPPVEKPRQENIYQGDYTFWSGSCCSSDEVTWLRERKKEMRRVVGSRGGRI